jgi:pimeloyl-ACP methyl ester carboxylesterase
MFGYPISVDGVATRVLQSGLEGHPVIFIHGTGTRADRFVRNLDVIADSGFRAYAIDLPGHGFADKDSAYDHSVLGYTEFLAGFIRGLIDDRVTLVGTSLGGHVAAKHAIENPSRVRGLVLVGAMGIVPLGREATSRIQCGAMMLSREDIAAKLGRVIADPSLITQNLIDEEFHVNNSPGARVCFEKLGRYIANQLDADLVGSELDRCGGAFPISLVWGREDRTVPLAVGVAAKGAVRGAKLAIISDSAHSVYFERPETFNRLLVRFMASPQTADPLEGVELID